jgi:hypothetical protein
MIMDTLGRQPSQPVNQCTKISHSQDHAGFMPRAIQKCSGSPATSQHLCNCTGELCVHPVHPVHQFTKLRTRPLTKSGGFPTPCLNETSGAPGRPREMHLKFAGGIDATGERGSYMFKMLCNSCNSCNAYS